MSLSSELRSKDSWLNQFFLDELGQVTEFAKREGAAIKALPVRVPLGTHGQASLVGTAFDYRVRLHLGDNVEESSVLTGGIDRMSAVEMSKGFWSDDPWANCTAQLLGEIPVGDESILSRVSVVLAWLDTGFRSGGRWSEGMKAVAKGIDEHGSQGWDHYAASADNSVADEVAALFAAAREHLPAFTGARIGPEFAGSPAVDGADADLIVENCLYDIKTTTDPRRKLPYSLRQLIGYALLDWDDEYALNQVGFYYSRQATLMTWPTSVPTLRTQIQQVRVVGRFELQVGWAKQLIEQGFLEHDDAHDL